MRYLPALLIGRLVRFAVRLVRPGGGSALPGLVVSKLAPNLVNKTLSSFPKGLVVITGTAGKSTTTKMVVAIARAHGLNVFTNPSTANIEQGFFSTIIKTGNVFGKVPGDIAIMEMDEGHAAELVRKVKPSLSVILNVFDDQLDRFVDPGLVREKLKIVALNTTSEVILNGDDQNCLLIGDELSVPKKYFGIDKSAGEIDYSPTYLPQVAKPNLTDVISKIDGREVVAKTLSGETEFTLPARGIHFALDAIAALSCSKSILGSQFDLALATKTLNEIPPVFSRGEVRKVNGEDVEFILVQNPISMQLNLDNLSDNLEQVFFAIGRDVHDPSWMWTVDLKNLKNVTTVSGFNYADAALLLEYHQIPYQSVEADYFKAIDDFFSLPKPKLGVKTVIYSADAMRRLRRYKGFTDPEDVARV